MSRSGRTTHTCNRDRRSADPGPAPHSKPPVPHVSCRHGGAPRAWCDSTELSGELRSVSRRLEIRKAGDWAGCRRHEPGDDCAERTKAAVIRNRRGA